MATHAIRTEADYRAALAEIDNLAGALEDSHEADRLTALSNAVQAYEAERDGFASLD